MESINTIKKLISALILILCLHPAWGAEKKEKEEPTSNSGMTEIELNGPLTLQIKAFIENQLKEREERSKKETMETLFEPLQKIIEKDPLARKEFEEVLRAHKKDFYDMMAAQKKEFDERLVAQKKESDASLQSQLKLQVETISKVIKKEPPSFQQRITANKYIWGIGLCTLGSMTMTFFHECTSIYSIPYAAARSVTDNLALLINLYYLSKIHQESSMIRGSLASQAAQ